MRLGQVVDRAAEGAVAAAAGTETASSEQVGEAGLRREIGGQRQDFGRVKLVGGHDSNGSDPAARAPRFPSGRAQ
jgi:hypothetical protein